MNKKKSNNSANSQKTNEEEEEEWDTLAVINYYLTIVVAILFTIVMCFSSKEKKIAYYHYKMAQLESIWKMWEDFWSGSYFYPYEYYDTTIIAEQVKFVKSRQHEDSVRPSNEDVKAAMKQISLQILQEEISLTKYSGITYDLYENFLRS